MNKMTKAEVENKMREILKVDCGIEGDVKDSDSFIGNLGLDALDHVELVMAIEEEFDIYIYENEADDMITFGDAVRIVEKKLGEGK